MSEGVWGYTCQWRRQDFDKEGAEVYRARNFDHAHLITSRAAPRGMYIRYVCTYGYVMGWRGAIERVIVTYVARRRCEEGCGAAVRLIAGWSLSYIC